jgi:DNA-binding Lrp family transcriptional regulator
MKFDKKDELILEKLKENSRLTVQEIAREIKIPQTTVFNRLKKLEDTKVIKKYSLQIDRSKIGKSVLQSYVLVNVDYSALKRLKIKQRELAKKLKEIKDVESVSIITGVGDTIVKIITENIENLNELVINTLREIDGVSDTKIAIILEDF